MLTLQTITNEQICEFWLDDAMDLTPEDESLIIVAVRIPIGKKARQTVKAARHAVVKLMNLKLGHMSLPEAYTISEDAEISGNVDPGPAYTADKDPDNYNAD